MDIMENNTYVNFLEKILKQINAIRISGSKILFFLSRDFFFVFVHFFELRYVNQESNKICLASRMSTV